MNKIIFASLLALAASSLAIAEPKPIATKTIIECSSYQNPLDMGTRVVVEELTFSGGSIQVELTQYEMTNDGEIIAYNAIVSDADETWFGTYDGTSVGYDASKIVSDRWGHPGHPGTYTMPDSAVKLPVKCTVGE